MACKQRETFRREHARPESFASSTSASLSLSLADGARRAKSLWFSYLTLFLVTVLAQALFALVRGDFVSFTFFSARHTAS
jgi:hypothetical protein